MEGVIGLLIVGLIIGSFLGKSARKPGGKGARRGTRGRKEARQPARHSRDAGRGRDQKRGHSGGIEIRLSVSGDDAIDSPPDVTTEDPTGFWKPPGEEVRIGTRRLPGGMVYVGSGLAAVSGLAVEPALIDPSLPTHDEASDPDGTSIGYWPSYQDLTPGQRSAYLDWLAGGRVDPEVTISFPFLFFYGLERRVFGDTAWVRPTGTEVQAIGREARRLQHLFAGKSRSFDGYLHRFVGTLYTRFAANKLRDGEPPSGEAMRAGSPVFEVALGQMAAAGDPVPAGWALAWAQGDSEISLRTPATRCPELFARLFRIRYGERYGAGIVIKPGKTRLRSYYRPASRGLHSSALIPVYTADEELPDVMALRRPRNQINDVVESVTEELAPYSRLIGKTPEASDTLKAQALLPAALIQSGADGELKILRDVLESQLGSQEQAVLSGQTLLDHFPTTKAGRPSKSEAVQLAQVLEHIDLGMEPDVRFTGSKPQASGQVVIFRLDEGAPSAPSEAYEAASLLIRLAAMVSGADGVVSAEEEMQIERQIERGLALDGPERKRLRAHLQWLLTDTQGMSGLKNRVASLDAAQRETVAETLITVAAADGEVDPAEITTLQKLYKLLDLDPEQVYTRVHQAAVEPVTVRPGRPDPAQYPVPAPADEAETSEEAGRAELDEVALRKKLDDTQRVASLLGDIFRDEEAEPAEADRRVEADEAESPVAGLDAEHSAIVRALGEATSWSREALEALSERHALLLDGAIDMINEAALDAVDAPLIEETDTGYEVDLGVYREMTQ